MKTTTISMGPLTSPPPIESPEQQRHHDFLDKPAQPVQLIENHDPVLRPKRTETTYKTMIRDRYRQMQMGEEPEADRPTTSRQLTMAEVDAFQRFCDLVGERAKAPGLTEEKLEELLVRPGARLASQDP